MDTVGGEKEPKRVLCQNVNGLDESLGKGEQKNQKTLGGGGKKEQRDPIAQARR